MYVTVVKIIKNPGLVLNRGCTVFLSFASCLYIYISVINLTIRDEVLRVLGYWEY